MFSALRFLYSKNLFSVNIHGKLRRLYTILGDAFHGQATSKRRFTENNGLPGYVRVNIDGRYISSSQQATCIVDVGVYTVDHFEHCLLL